MTIRSLSSVLFVVPQRWMQTIISTLRVSLKATSILPAMQLNNQVISHQSVLCVASMLILSFQAKGVSKIVLFQLVFLNYASFSMFDACTLPIVF